MIIKRGQGKQKLVSKKKKQKELKIVTKVDEYFRDLVANAMMEQKSLRRSPQEVESYLVNLLIQFMTTESLFKKDAEGNLTEEPIVIMLKEALEEERREEQSKLLRRVGDSSLYMAGFFQERLHRKMVGLDYYIGMGESAYRQVAIRSEPTLNDLFEELSRKFAALVDVMAHICEKTTVHKEKDLIRLYEFWLSTKSERAKKTLEEAGIIPEAVNKKH